MKPLKVLHIIKNFNLGGAETNLLNLIKAMDPARVENHVAYSKGGEIEDRFRRENLRFFRYAENDHKIKSLATLAIILKLRSYLISQKIDIVHTHNFNAHVWGCLAAKLSGCRVVEHVHDFRYMEWQEFTRRKGSVYQYRFIKYFKGMSDRVVVLTAQNKEYLLEHGFYPAGRIREIHNGIPLERKTYNAQEVRLRLGLMSENKVVLIPARISAEKNIDRVLDIAAEVLNKVPHVIFLVAGDGPLKTALVASVHARKLERHVKFLGFYEDIPELLSIADVFLLPSFLELHSISILEALSMKVPVVTSQEVGCNSDVFHSGLDALLCDPFSKDGWGEAVTRLLLDKALHDRLGEEGARLCQSRFDIKKTAGAFTDLYEELCPKNHE